MAKYHISEINKEVNRNPLLKDMMTNRAPKADFTFRYDTGNGGTAEILHGGLFSFTFGFSWAIFLRCPLLVPFRQIPMNISMLCINLAF